MSSGTVMLRAIVPNGTLNGIRDDDVMMSVCDHQSRKFPFQGQAEASYSSPQTLPSNEMYCEHIPVVRLMQRFIPDVTRITRTLL